MDYEDILYEETALDAGTIALPHYDGNGMFLSLGNQSVNPHVGLLFVDFSAPRRLRLAGRARSRPEGAAAGRARTSERCA